MAEGLVPHWVAAGHEVVIGGRSPLKAQELATRVGARAGSIRDAAQFGDVIFLAVLHAGVASTLQEAGAQEGTLSGKVLIECTNAIERERGSVATLPGGSVSEQVAAATSARVAKAFNQVHYDVWRRGARYCGQPLVVPISGDHDAKALAATLVRDAGGEPLDVGGIEHAHELEAMAAVIIRLLFAGTDPLSAFQLTVGSPERQERSAPERAVR